MATFKEQVEGLTGLSVGTTPTNTELSTFLTDGAKDVINRVVKIDPVAAQQFGTITDVSSSGQIVDGDILDVWGSDGTNDHPATLVPISVGKRAADSDSLHYRYKYNPCYYREGRKLVIKPDGGSVLHVSYPMVSYTSESIYNFPEQYIHLPVLYASIQSLMATLADYSIADLKVIVAPTLGSFVDVTESIPTWDSPSLTMPPIPSDANIDFSSVPNAPSFISPSFEAPSLGSIGDLSLPAAPTVPSEFVSNSVDLDSLTVPTYNGPVVAPDFSTAATYIETEEDTELASAQLQKIQAQISEYQALMSNALNKFNEENVKYQAQIQDRIKDVDLKESANNRELQRFSAEVSVYQAEVNSNIQLWQQEEWTQNFNKYTQDYQYLLTEHSNDIQKEQARVQNDLAIYQQEINKATSTYTAETGYDLNKYQAEVSANVQKFSSDLQLETARHQAELAQYTSELSVITEKNNRTLQKFSSELSSYNADMQQNLNVFNSELQDKQTTYKWMTERAMVLKNQYDSALMLMAPQEQKGE